jgi:hypothetical protein
MEPRDRERVSRVLEAALASLNEEAHGDERPSNVIEVTGVRLPSSDAQISGASVVILIHPNSNQREVIPNAPATQVEAPSSCGCGHDGSKPHPGFERFPISESDPRDPSKMCFIEPDRVCVGSGACETLGY